MTRLHPLRLGLFLATAGGLLFSFDLPILRLAGADSWTLIFLRGIFLSLSITVLWLILQVASGRRTPYIAGVPGVAVAVSSTFASLTYIGAVNTTTAANIVFITALIPVITAILAWIFSNDRIHVFTWIATGLALLGVALIGWDSASSGNWRGDLLAFISMVCTATSLTIIRASGKNLTTSLAVGSLSSALIAFFFIPSTTIDVGIMMWVALSGLIVMPLASALIANSPRFLPSADVSMFFLLETTLTPVWIWLLFGESPTGLALVGGALIVVTLLAHSFWRLSQTRGQGKLEISAVNP